MFLEHFQTLKALTVLCKLSGDFWTSINFIYYKNQGFIGASPVQWVSTFKHGSPMPELGFSVGHSTDSMPCFELKEDSDYFFILVVQWEACISKLRKPTRLHIEMDEEIIFSGNWAHDTWQRSQIFHEELSLDLFSYKSEIVDGYLHEAH